MHKSKKILFSILIVLGILAVGAIGTFAYNSEYFEGNVFRILKRPIQIQKIEKNAQVAPLKLTTKPLEAEPATEPKLESQLEPKVNLKIDSKFNDIPKIEITTEHKLTTANINVMTLPEDDPIRGQLYGNVDMGQFIEKFYQTHDDDFDMLIAIGYNSDDAHGRGNGISDGFLIKDVPTNLGKVDFCGTSLGLGCELYPENLKYIQQLVYRNYTYEGFPTFTALHEIGHYWGVDWHQANNDQCYTDLGMPWVNQLLENGHWTERFQAGNTSTLTYPTHFLEDRDPNNPLTKSTVWEGSWTDNYDGTFTKNGIFMNARREGFKFNNIDLYAMGLMSAEEVAEEEIFLVLDPELISADPVTAIATYSGTRMDLTLDDIQDLLHARGNCEGIGPNYYYTGNGDRDMQGRPEFSDNFRIGFTLIQHSDNMITEDHAYHLCKIINEEVVNQWHNATQERSVLNVNLSPNTTNPNCEELFPEAAENYIPLAELYPDNNNDGDDSDGSGDDDGDALGILY